METKFTPGPWRAEVVLGWGSDPVVVSDAWPKPVASLIPHSDRYYQHVKTTTICGEQCVHFGEPTAEGEARKAEVDAQLVANARLIAAAPDLYAALADVTVLLAQCRCHRKLSSDEEMALDFALAALAKARGQA